MRRGVVAVVDCKSVGNQLESRWEMQRRKTSWESIGNQLGINWGVYWKYINKKV